MCRLTCKTFCLLACEIASSAIRWPSFALFLRFFLLPPTVFHASSVAADAPLGSPCNIVYALDTAAI